MTTIDVGPGASNRATALNRSSYTFLSATNVANDTGKITSAEIWFNSNGGGVKVGTFSGSSTNWTYREGATIGSVTSGSKQTFTGLSFAVSTNDRCGYLWTSGNCEMDTYGSTAGLEKLGDHMTAEGAQSYSSVYYFDCSFYLLGGTSSTYNDSAADGLKLGDSDAASVTRTSSATDGAKLGDSARVVGTQIVPVTDGAKLGDTPTHTYVAKPSSSDGAKLSDTPVTQDNIKRGVTDGAKLGDVASTQDNIKRAVSDGTKLGDTATHGYVAKPSASDGLKAGDSTLHDYIAKPTSVDGIKLGDSTATQANTKNSASDGVKLSDSVLPKKYTYPIDGDGVKFGDTALGVRNTYLVDIDGAKLGDTPGTLVTWKPAGSDGLSLSDAAEIAIHRGHKFTRTAYRIEIHDRGGLLLWALRDFEAGTLETQFNEPAVVSFSCPINTFLDAKLSSITRPNEVWVYKDDVKVFSGQFGIITTEHGKVKRIQVDAVDYMLALKAELVETYDADAAIATHVAAMLAQQVSPRPVLIGSIAPIVSRDITIAKDYVYDALMALRDTVGGYLQVDANRKLNWYYGLGTNTGKQIRYRKNLIGITYKEDWYNFGDRLFIYGPTFDLSDTSLGTTYIEDTASIAKWGLSVRKYDVGNEYNNPVTFLEYAQRKLKDSCVPRISYSIDVLNLEDYGLSYEELSLGDVVRVIDEEIGVNVEAQIVKLTRDLVTGQNIKMEIAATPGSVYDLLSQKYL
jgi:phage minor structural protein